MLTGAKAIAELMTQKRAMIWKVFMVILFCWLARYLCCYAVMSLLYQAYVPDVWPSKLFLSRSWTSRLVRYVETHGHFWKKLVPIQDDVRKLTGSIKSGMDVFDLFNRTIKLE
jgi:hypothetical protein